MPWSVFLNQDVLFAAVSVDLRIVTAMQRLFTDAFNVT